MLGFYVLLEDPDANVIIALALLQLGFLQVMTYAILLISPGRWLQAKTQQPIGVVSLVIIHVNACCRPADQQHLMMRYSITKYAVVIDDGDEHSDSYTCKNCSLFTTYNSKMTHQKQQK